MPRPQTAAPRARLLVQVTESGRPRSFDWSLPTAPGAEMTVGRSRSTDLTLRDEHVSGRHLRIVVTPDGHALIDLEATNGTTLNDQTFTPHAPQPLSPGDRIVLGGSAELVYQIDPTTAPPPSTAASAPPPESAAGQPQAPANQSGGSLAPADDSAPLADDQPPADGSAGSSLATVMAALVIGLAILGVIGYFGWVLLAAPPG